MKGVVILSSSLRFPLLNCQKSHTSPLRSSSLLRFSLSLSIPLPLTHSLHTHHTYCISSIIPYNSVPVLHCEFLYSLFENLNIISKYLNRVCEIFYRIWAHFNTTYEFISTESANILNRISLECANTVDLMFWTKERSWTRFKIVFFPIYFTKILFKDLMKRVVWTQRTGVLPWQEHFEKASGNRKRAFFVTHKTLIKKIYEKL